MKKIFLGAFVFLLVLKASAGNVDTVSIYSESMHRAYKCVVISPKSEGTMDAHFPTLYLLHGFGGGYSNWIKRVPELSAYADRYQMIIVCPDGAFSSWYVDSPIDSTMKFETYVGEEIPAYIDKHFPTIKDRNARAITGLSMGGHGGLFLGFRHADLFGACGSMSGALILDYITRGYDVEKRLGDTVTNRHYYKELTIMKQMETYPKDSLSIIIDCGVDDMIIGMSRAAHQKMLQLKIPHTYIERPGKHDWKYWAEAVQYQLLFFRRFFDRGKQL